MSNVIHSQLHLKSLFCFPMRTHHHSWIILFVTRILELEINSLEITKNRNGRIFAWLMKAHHRTTAYFYLVSYRYLYSRLAKKHRRRYTGKQLLWIIFVSVGETRGDFTPSLKNMNKIRIFPAATRKYLSKIRFFRTVTGNISANQFFYAPKTNYFCRTKFTTAEKVIKIWGEDFF